jgi:hypothetical protein
MNYKKWSILVITIAFSFCVLLMSVNYVIDPFNIFHTKFLKYQYQMNERFIKIEFLEKEHDQFNSYMFGSSRIGSTNPKTIEKYIPNSKFYNLTASGATLYDDLKILEYFIENEYNVKNIYLQIDIRENMDAYTYNKNDYLRKHHPYVSKESLLKYYMNYLTIFPWENIQRKVENNILGEENLNYNLQTGAWTNEKAERKLMSNPQDYIKNEPSFHAESARTQKGIYTSQNLSALKEIKKLCDQNNINLIIFITPHNDKLLDTIVLEDYIKFLVGLSEISAYWDFSGYNTVTLNNENYYEYSHYRPLVSHLIAARIFNDENVHIPSDFGYYVTKQNIQEYVKLKRSEVQLHDEISH